MNVNNIRMLRCCLIGKFLFICFPKVDDKDDESYGDFSGDLPLC